MLWTYTHVLGIDRIDSRIMSKYHQLNFLQPKNIKQLLQIVSAKLDNVFR